MKHTGLLFKASVAIIILSFLAYSAVKSLCSSLEECSQRAVKTTPIVFGEVDGLRMMPTHIYFSEQRNKQIISDFANSRFLFSDLSPASNSTTWNVAQFSSIKRPHVVTHHLNADTYFAADTDNNEIIRFKSVLGTDQDITRYKKIGNIDIGNRPHDIAYNSSDDYIYVMISSGVLRFQFKDDMLINVGHISKTDISDALQKKAPHFKVGYMRSLTFVDGTLYLINSTYGNIVQINNFDQPASWSVYINNNQPDQYSEAGSYDKHGLILNDIDYYKGYWYASNYYKGSQSNFRSEAAVSKNKLIRWKTWEDFKNSNWQDLSHLVHEESIPYNFTRYNDELYISMFHSGNSRGLGSGVYQINTNYF